jgi:hypothetical protein
MISDVRATFLHLIADNLTGITVHPVRQDSNDPASSVMQVEAVNVEFMNVNTAVVGSQSVSIDVISADESNCIAWIDALWTILSAAFFTPLLSYQNPTAPTPLGTNVMWDRDRVRFVKVAADTYSHYSCVLPLRFHSA